jgi:hypothetical protein
MASVKDSFVSLPVDKLELHGVLKSCSRHVPVTVWLAAAELIVSTWVGTNVQVNGGLCLLERKGILQLHAKSHGCDNHHKIQAVSQGHPGARNNKTIVKLDNAAAAEWKKRITAVSEHIEHEV